MDKLEQFIQIIEENHLGLTLKRDVSMAQYTSFRIGGAVSLMAIPATAQQLAACLRVARQLGVPTHVIGRGSNLLVADEGVDALVIITHELSHMERTAPNQITAGAGVSLARLATFAAEENLGGLTFAHGIPGSLGGAVTMNAGAYGGEMKDVVTRIRYMNAQGQIEDVLGQDAQFGYRHSIFSESKLVVVEVVLTLPQGNCNQLKEEMAAMSAKRRSSQPLEYPSGGSMFKRPVGHYAGSLIEECGLKGFAVGGAQVSEKHAGFVVNRGGATCADVLSLVEQVQSRVLQQTGVVLEMEVKVLR